MKKILFASVLFIVAMTFSTTINAQNFPATEKAIKEILCATKWKADTVILDNEVFPAVDMLGQVLLEIKPDGKYTLTVDSKTTKDIWKIDLVNKSVDFYEKDEKMTSIRNILATRIEISEVEEDKGKGETMTVIFKPVK